MTSSSSAAPGGSSSRSTAFNFFSPAKEKFGFFNKDSEKTIGKLADDVSTLVAMQKKPEFNMNFNIQDRQPLNHAINTLAKLSEMLSDISGGSVTTKKFSLIQNTLSEAEKDLANLPKELSNNDSAMQQEFEKISTDIKDVVKDLGLVNRSGSGSESKVISAIDALAAKADKNENEDLKTLLQMYKSFLLPLHSGLVNNVRVPLEAIVRFVNNHPAVFNADPEMLSSLGELNANIAHLVEDMLKRGKIAITDKTYPIDLFVSLSYLENKFNDPIIHAAKLIDSFSDELEDVKEAYFRVLVALKEDEDIDLSQLQSALLEVSGDWPKHANVLVQANNLIAQFLNEREVIDTKEFTKIKNIIQEVNDNKGTPGNIRSYIAGKVSESTMVNKLIDKAITKVGISKDEQQNTERFAAKLDPTKMFNRPDLAHGEHYDYGANLDSVISYYLDYYGGKIPVLKDALGLIKEPIMAMVREKLDVISTPEHFDAIMCDFLNDITEIIHNLASETPPEGYDLTIEEFAKIKYQSIVSDLGIIVKMSPPPTEKAKFWQLKKKIGNEIITKIYDLLGNKHVVDFITKKMDKKSNKIVAKTTQAITKGKGKAVRSIEKNAEKIGDKIESKTGESSFDKIKSYLEDKTRLGDALEDVDIYGEYIAWDLAAKLIRHVRVELEKASQENIEEVSSNKSPVPDMNANYKQLIKSLNNYLLFGPSDLTKQIIYKIVNEYSERINPSDISEKVCTTLNEWVHASPPERPEVKKHKHLDVPPRVLHEYANQGYLDARLEIAEIVIKREKDKLQGSSSTSTAQKTSGDDLEDLKPAALEHMNIALMHARKPKDIRRALQGLADIYEHGIGVKQDLKLAEKYRDQLQLYPPEHRVHFFGKTKTKAGHK